MSYVIHSNVEIGPDAEIGDFAIIGVSPIGMKPGELETHIGSFARIRSHTVIYAGNHIGANFQTGHGAMIRESNVIGDGVSIGSHSIVEHHVKIGNRVRIHSNAFIPEYSILEDHVWIGPNVVFTNALYPLSPEVKKNLKGPHIMPGAKIGANSTLLPGVIIGRNSLIGAGSVIVHDVPNGKVMVGNPGRVIKDVRELSAYDLEQLEEENE